MCVLGKRFSLFFCVCVCVCVWFECVYWNELYICWKKRDILKSLNWRRELTNFLKKMGGEGERGGGLSLSRWNKRFKMEESPFFWFCFRFFFFF